MKVATSHKHSVRRFLPALLLLALIGAGLAFWLQRPPGPAITLSYAPDPRQQVDGFAAPVPGERRPAILWVHGGGWDGGDRVSGGGTKPVRFEAAGWRWLSVGYRLVPGATLSDQLGDVAAAVAAVRRDAARLGADPDRIVLAGHSSGAHLVAMLGTDPRWLARAGVPASAIAGIALFDSAVLDVPPLMRSALSGTFPHHDNAFGRDPGHWRAMSPMLHAGGDDLARWLIVYDAGTTSSDAQARTFTARLRRGGADVTLIPVTGTDHGRIDAEFGRPGDPVAGVMLGWLGSPHSPAS